jgi:hypothetical protein
LLINKGYNSSFAKGADSMLKRNEPANFNELNKTGNCSLYIIDDPKILSNLKLYSTSDF